MAPFADAPEEVDQTIFSVNKVGGIGIASRLAQNLVQEANRSVISSIFELSSPMLFIAGFIFSFD